LIEKDVYRKRIKNCIKEIKKLRKIKIEKKRKIKKKIIKYIINLEDKMIKRKKIYKEIKVILLEEI